MSSIIHRIQELWHRLRNKNDSRNEDSSERFSDFQTFTKYVDETSRETADKLTTLSVQCSAKQVQNNGPHEIPLSICRFSQLRSLQVNNCGLSTVPWSLVYLKQLHTLDISNNRIMCLPRVIGSLKSLRCLNVENNLLLVLPTSLLDLKELQELKLDGNKTLQSPSYDLCKQGLNSILKNISQRPVYTNMWAGCRLAGAYQPSQVFKDVPSLFYLAANTVTSYSLDFLSASFVPPRIKTFLVEEKNFEIQVAKCSSCHCFFSNAVMLEAHPCRGIRS